MILTRPRSVALLFGLRRVLAIGLLLGLLGACNKPAAPAAATLVEGQAFPAFMLDFIANRNEATPSWQGKVLVLNVWATWCPPCRREMPDLELLSKTLDPKRFAVIGLSVDGDTRLAAEFLLQHGITFANFFDQNGQVARPLALQAYPQTFVIAPDRTLLRRIIGYRDWASPEMVGMLEGLAQTHKPAAQ